MSEPRILVFGYSAVGRRGLELLLERGGRVVGLVTHENDPAETLWFASVAELARANDIPVSTPKRVDAAVIAAIREQRPDLILSLYYRLLLPQAVIDLPPLGAFNIHGSLLPRYRGRAPVNWAIANGETETGATLHHMVERADAGDIVDQERVAISASDDAGSVSIRVADAACAILERQLDALRHGRAPRRAQDERLATTFGRRRPEDGRIDWRLPARTIVDLVRAVARPFPGAFSDGPWGRLFIWRAAVVAGGGPPGRVLGIDPIVVAAGEQSVRVLECSGGDGVEPGETLGSGARSVSAGPEFAPPRVVAPAEAPGRSIP